MKKLLAIVLILALALPFSVGATATLMSPALPEVTDIVAVWNGEVLMDDYLQPIFTPENLEVTVTINGNDEVLEFFSNRSNAGWWWRLEFDIDFDVDDDEDAKVTVFFYCSRSVEVFLLGNTWDEEAYREGQPQYTFDFDYDFLADFIDGLPMLTLGESVYFEDGQYFRFVANADGRHFVFSRGNHDLAIFNAQGVRMTGTDLDRTSRAAVRIDMMRAGQTYIIRADYYSGQNTLTVAQRDPRNWLQRLLSAVMPIFDDIGEAAAAITIIVAMVVAVINLVRMFL